MNTAVDYIRNASWVNSSTFRVYVKTHTVIHTLHKSKASCRPITYLVSLKIYIVVYSPINS